MKRVLKTNNGRSARVSARNFYGVFDRFSAAIHENAFLRKRAGNERIEFLRQRNVFFIRRYAETRVNECVELFANGSDHARRAMASVDHADAAGKVEEAIAVHVLENCAFCARGKNRRRVRNATRHSRLTTPHQFLRLRAWNGSTQLNCGHVSTTQSAVQRVVYANYV